MSKPATSVTPPESHGGRADGDRFRLLFVCTGNICRSAFAERLTRARLSARLGADARLFDVSSAGVHGLVGEPMDPHLVDALVSRGGTSSGFVSRRLEVEHVAGVDLALGMTREHRAAAVRCSPPVVPRAFTLLEAARLAQAAADMSSAALAASQVPAGDDPLGRARLAVQSWGAARGTVPWRPPGLDDIEDPIGRPQQVHDSVAAQIADAVEVLVDDLTR